MTDWPTIPLRKLINEDRGISYGIVQPGSHDPSGVPIIRVNNIRNNAIETTDHLKVSRDVEKKYSRTRLQGGEVLLTLVGTIGQSAVVPPALAGWNLARAVAIIPAANGVSPQWINICLRSPLVQNTIRAKANTTVQATFNLKDVNELPIVMPPESERHTIEAFIVSLDQRIELLQQENETLEAMARAIFKSWFVDFDPVRAKAEGRTPEGMDATTAALFPSTFTDSPLGPIPEGWAVGSLSHYADLQNGFAFKSADWKDVGVPVVKIGSVKPGVVDLANVSYVSDEIANKASNFRLAVGDLLVGLTGYVGETGIVPPTSNLPLLNQRVARFKTKRSEGFSPFIYCVARQQEFKAYAEENAHGSAQPNVSTASLLKFPVVVTNGDAAVKAFDEQVMPLIKKILINYEEIASLADLRDTLLPRLISGKLRLTDAAAIVENAA